MSNVTFEYETPEGQKRTAVIPAENIKVTGPDGQPNPTMLLASILIMMDSRVRALESNVNRLEGIALSFEDRITKLEQMFAPDKFETTVDAPNPAPEVYDV